MKTRYFDGKKAVDLWGDDLAGWTVHGGDEPAGERPDPSNGRDRRQAVSQDKMKADQRRRDHANGDGGKKGRDTQSLHECRGLQAGQQSGQKKRLVRAGTEAAPDEKVGRNDQGRGRGYRHLGTGANNSRPPRTVSNRAFRDGNPAPDLLR